MLINNTLLLQDMNRRLRYCFVISVCTTVGEMVILIPLVIYWLTERMELAEGPAPKEERACIPYAKYTSIKKGNTSCPDGLMKEIERKKNVSVCCGRMSDVLDKIIPKVFYLCF